MWTAKQQHRWTARGGTSEQATAFAVEGWSFPEVEAAFAANDDFGQLPSPAGIGRWAALLGDELAALLRLPLPELDDAAGLWCGRRHLDGRQEVWELKEADSGVTVTLHARSSIEDPWTTSTTLRPETDVVDALEALDDPRTLSGEVITVVLLGPDAPTEQSILEVLRVGPSPPAPECGWPEHVVDRWAESVEDVEAAYPDIAWHTLWSSVGGSGVTSIATRDDGRPVFVPVLCDPDEQALVPVEELATTSWFSESGGAPISWDGGNGLYVLNDDLGLERQWGDMGAADEVFRWPPDTESRAQVVAQWIVGCDAQVAAAFTLQPVDPNGTLSPDEAQDWRDRIDALTIDMSLDVSQAVLDRVAHLLGADPRYAQTVRALTDPSGPEGQRLSAAINATLADGVTGELTYGDWDAPSDGD